MSGLLSNLANAGSQASAKKYNSAEAAAERAFQKEMRGTAYQDTVKDMIAAGINPILAATNGATSAPSGASASIGSQHYNQQSAQAASVSAMYEYGNNTAELAEKYLQLAKQSTSAKQLKNAKSWEQAASELATSSAKQAQQYSYAANKLGSGELVLSLFPGHCMTKGGVDHAPYFFVAPGSSPDFFVVPIILNSFMAPTSPDAPVLSVQAVEHGVESRVHLDAGKDIDGHLVQLPADTCPVRIIAGSGDQEKERLRSGVAAPFCHYIE